MTASFSDERSPLLHPSGSQRFGRIGRRTRLIVSGLALLLLLAGAVSCVAIVLRMLCGSVASAPPSFVTPLVLEQEFDAIVIGGGPAGSVVSKLLSDDPWRRVLLIEAGNASQTQLGGTDAIPSPLNAKGLTPFDVPFYWTNVANTPSLHWAYPDVNVAKALGGCGIHNAMLYVRALPSDLERWQIDKWTWEEALTIYMAIEDYDGANSSFHSTGGFVRTSPPALEAPLTSEFIEACMELGIPRTADFNAPGGRYGAGYYHFNTRDGVRESAAKAFLGPILDSKTAKSTRSNFRLMLDTTVTKIRINDDNVTEGVEVRYRNGTEQLIRLAEHGEVIVTAGAINTPKILMLSGIGNSDTLKKVGLPLKKHLPRVGMNLQDHPVVGMTFECEMPRVIDLRAELESYFEATNSKRTNASSFGLFGSAGISAGAFLIPPGSTLPEIQLTLFPRKSEPHMSNSAELNHVTEVIITIALLHPLARNRVVLVHDSDNSVDDNDIDDHLIPRVVSEVPESKPEHLREGDVWKITWAIGVVREIAAKLDEKDLIGKEITPGADVTATKDLEEWVFNSVFRNSHWVGSASMGTSEEKAVVDNHLRVFGIKNLRVADASVIPLIPNGNVHSSVVMVANRAAQILREDEADYRRRHAVNAK
ncbi:putative choline dehydrogenase [Phytophthora cinnamomi]|uniref:putative choline dehydrogenase n=1 Tax=Phytophthora cinnamomi TaxID=4785 RepID=UPI00355AA998|nr:putative choline dehydrogenase [Phytophthora cinnamomi]